MFWRKLFTTQFIKDAFYSLLIIIFLYVITHNPITHPKQKPTPGNWSIQFMQHPLLFGFAGHNYLALRDENGTVVSELHGLATDTHTGEWKYIGAQKTDILKVWEFENSRYYIAGKSFPGIILTQGNQSTIETTWNMHHACTEVINTKYIPYPPYGFSIKNETKNSNSVAYTLAKCMGLDTRHIGIFTPGSTMDLLP